jgi:signal transduction histidine kinase
MSDVRRLVSMPDDPKGRLIAIFVGAVLLPSLALSIVSLRFVKELAQKKEATEIQRAERTLYYVEKDLVETAHKKALEAAQMLGPEALLDGRPEVIKTALVDEGMGEGIFESLHLEGSSPRVLMKAHEVEGVAADPDLSPDILAVVDLDAKHAKDGKDGEDSVPWPGEDGRFTGTLRFKFACSYVHGRLIRDYFEKDFVNPAQSLVIRVMDGTHVVYETFPTTKQRFEVEQKMRSPSFRGLTLALRYRDYSIEQDIRRWRIGTLCLVGFIDIMLGAGLFLVYSNVRREVHLSRIKSDFVANVSHELKTPLALIRLFSETLELGRVPTEEKARQYYRVINKESQRLTQLINNILDFSRIEAGRKEYRFAPTDVGRVVSEVVDAYRFQIEQQGFALEVHVADDLPEVPADQEALGQALLNLLNNSVKYTRDEKYIRLDVRKDADRVLISVTDRGIGVAKSEQKKIFEKFYRAEDSLVHETKGSGLGLPLVRHIMEAHGGTVEVESGPGRGSTFTLVLPFARDTTKLKDNR